MSRTLPILFNTEMVRAILDGRKTVTRWVVKGASTEWNFEYLDSDAAITAIDRYGDEYAKDVDGLWATFEVFDGPVDFPMIKSPYQPGDILYVRETFVYEECDPDCAGRTNEDECPFNRVGDKCYGYKTQFTEETDDIKWHPSIHMPKAAARIFLRVTDVRVERLQDITADEAEKEGVGSLFLGDCAYDDKYHNIPWVQEDGLSVHQFARLWDSTIKPADLPLYGWDANPWVWVYEFERVKKP